MINIIISSIIQLICSSSIYCFHFEPLILIFFSIILGVKNLSIIEIIKYLILLFIILININKPSDEFLIPNFIYNPNQLSIYFIYLLYHNNYNTYILNIYFSIIEVYYKNKLILIIPSFNNLNINLLTINYSLSMFLIHSFDFGSLQMKNVSNIFDGLIKFYLLRILFLLNIFSFKQQSLFKQINILRELVIKNLIDMFIILISSEIHEGTLVFQWYFGSRMFIMIIYFINDFLFYFIFSFIILIYYKY